MALPSHVTAGKQGPRGRELRASQRHMHWSTAPFSSPTQSDVEQNPESGQVTALAGTQFASNMHAPGFKQMSVPEHAGLQSAFCAPESLPPSAAHIRSSMDPAAHGQQPVLVTGPEQSAFLHVTARKHSVIPQPPPSGVGPGPPDVVVVDPVLHAARPTTRTHAVPASACFIPSNVPGACASRKANGPGPRSALARDLRQVFGVCVVHGVDECVTKTKSEVAKKSLRSDSVITMPTAPRPRTTGASRRRGAADPTGPSASRRRLPVENGQDIVRIGRPSSSARTAYESAPRLLERGGAFARRKLSSVRSPCGSRCRFLWRGRAKIASSAGREVARRSRRSRTDGS